MRHQTWPNFAFSRRRFTQSGSHGVDVFGPAAGRGDRGADETFREAAHESSSRVEVLVLIHRLFQQAMLHCQAPIWVRLEKLKPTGDQSA